MFYNSLILFQCQNILLAKDTGCFAAFIQTAISRQLNSSTEVHLTACQTSNVSWPNRPRFYVMCPHLATTDSMPPKHGSIKHHAMAYTHAKWLGSSKIPMKQFHMCSDNPTHTHFLLRGPLHLENYRILRTVRKFRLMSQHTSGKRNDCI